MWRFPVVALGLITMLGVTGCGVQWGVQPSLTLTTTTPGVTERWLKLDWTVEPDTGTARQLSGHVENMSGRPITQVQLLIQSLDGTGNLVDQRRQWLGGGLGPGGRQYFAVRHLPAADQYRVNVWSYNAVEVNGSGADFR